VGRILQFPPIINGLGQLWASFGFNPFFYDPRMGRLLLAICYENIATGIALTAFVAYLSGIISKKFTAVQYALLSSLTFLVGSLGRGFAGESFDKYGYALVFRWTAAAGLVAVLFVLLEWWRVSVQERRGRIEADTAPKVGETAGVPAGR
jgi:PAT family beta-lactamase induction signal transducer AmpG